jgi:hypothetical protein
MATFRIPIVVETPVLSNIEDFDLAFLLDHCGGGLPDTSSLAARNAAGETLPVQWLSRCEPSMVAGQRRGTLFIEPNGKAGRQELALFVQTGKDAPVKKPPTNDKGVNIKESKDLLEIFSEGKPFVTYRFNTKDKELPRPYFHPLIGPGGQTITQVGEVPGKRVAHFHHTALWIAHQKFVAKGEAECDNWQIGRPNSSRIEHVRFENKESGALACRFTERLNWLNVKGDRVLLEETRLVTIPRLPPARRIIDLDIRLRAVNLAVTFQRTPYHLLACRVLNEMLPGKGGVITNSAGAQSPADGAPASWIDISGQLAGAWQGVALFNHADNFRNPTPCLQFARQTIGLSPTHREPHTLEPKQELRLRFRVFVHSGNVADGRVAAEYQAYVKPASTRIGGPEPVLG